MKIRGQQVCPLSITSQIIRQAMGPVRPNWCPWNRTVRSLTFLVSRIRYYFFQHYPLLFQLYIQSIFILHINYFVTTGFEKVSYIFVTASGQGKYPHPDPDPYQTKDLDPFQNVLNPEQGCQMCTVSTAHYHCCGPGKTLRLVQPRKQTAGKKTRP